MSSLGALRELALGGAEETLTDAALAAAIEREPAGVASLRALRLTRAGADCTVAALAAAHNRADGEAGGGGGGGPAGLSELSITWSPLLSDGGVSQLAALGALRRLTLDRCKRVSDVSLAPLVRALPRLRYVSAVDTNAVLHRQSAFHA